MKRRKTIRLRWILDGAAVHETTVDGRDLAALRDLIRSDPGLQRYDLDVSAADEESDEDAP